VNDSKSRISELKALIEQRRIQRAVAAGDLSGGSGARDEAGGEDDAEEARCRAHIERVRRGGKCYACCVCMCVCVYTWAAVVQPILRGAAVLQARALQIRGIDDMMLSKFRRMMEFDKVHVPNYKRINKEI